jgi:hypothetical protein
MLPVHVPAIAEGQRRELASNLVVNADAYVKQDLAAFPVSTSALTKRGCQSTTRKNHGMAAKKR